MTEQAIHPVLFFIQYLILLSESKLKHPSQVGSCPSATNSQQRDKYRLPGHGLRQLILEVIADVRADPVLVERLAEDPSAENAEKMMLDFSRRFPSMLAPHLPALFGLFESGDVPVLIHCAASKNRTVFGCF
ncbi:hypothetical protein D3C86_1666640 [compost metagenome]